MPRITRADARQHGDKTYFTGCGCPYGHVDYRYTSSGRCVVCTKLAMMDPAVWRAMKLPRLTARAEAIKWGLPRYFTGRPCLHGHIVERQTRNCVCMQCSNEKVAAYRARDPEAWRAQMRRNAAARKLWPDDHPSFA